MSANFWSTYIFWNYSFVWMHAQEWDCYLMQRADLLEKTLMLGEIEGRRRRA